MSAIYVKYAPNVYLAKTADILSRGDTIMVTTKYGKENECTMIAGESDYLDYIEGISQGEESEEENEE